MSRYLVSVQGGTPAAVDAKNWLCALGDGLDQLGIVQGIDRLACEVLPNGTVIARDVRSGAGYIVKPVSGDLAAPHGSDEASEEEEMEILVETSEPTAMDGMVVALVDTVRSAPSELSAWQGALEVAVELVGAHAGAALAREVNGDLLFVGAEGPHAHKLLGATLPAEMGVAGFCVSRGSAIMVSNPYQDDRFFKNVDQMTGFTTEEVLCVPVVLEGEVVGCLELLNPDGGSFHQRHLELTEFVAVALADRLGNA